MNRWKVSFKQENHRSVFSPGISQDMLNYIHEDKIQGNRPFSDRWAADNLHSIHTEWLLVSPGTSAVMTCSFCWL